MKITSKLIISALTLLALAATAHAQSPREQLQLMVGQLRANPNDHALRGRIIKQAQEIKPAPAVPEEAIRYEGRAQFAFKSAKSKFDFLAAAEEYEKAVAAAPWVPGYYSDLCAIYEEAGKFEDAKRNCGFYLIGLSDSAQMTDVKRRIAGLEFGIEKAAAEKRRAVEEAAKRQEEEENSPRMLVQQLQAKYGNRRMKEWHNCRGYGHESRVACSESEAQGATYTDGAHEGSYTWVQTLSKNKTEDYTSQNIRYVFRLESSNQNRIIIGYADGGDAYCGTPKGAGVSNIEWRECSNGSAMELRFYTTSAGRPVLEITRFCDTSRVCDRTRLLLE